MKKELISFQYAFQITKTIVFEIKYYRLGNNTNKYFSTSAVRFNRPKTNYNQCGQAQKSLLEAGSIARMFFNKFDYLHIRDLNKEQHKEILKNIEFLKIQYNFVERMDSNNNFNFSELVDLSKQKLKKIK